MQKLTRPAKLKQNEHNGIFTAKSGEKAPRHLLQQISNHETNQRHSGESRNPEEKQLLFVARILFVSFLLFSHIQFQTSPAWCETVFKLIKLNMQSPSAVASVLQQTFGRQIRVAEAPMVNGVVVSSDNPSILIEAEKLVKNIDRVPATLRYQIKSVGEEEVYQLTAGMKTSVDQSVIIFEPTIENRKISGRGSQTRMITGMEGQPVSLTDQITQVMTLGSPWGPQDHIRTENRGLQISGRLAGDDGYAIVEIGYAEGGFNQSQNLQTVVKVPLGRWLLIGTLLGDGTDRTGQTTIISKSGRIDHTKIRSAQNKSYLIRIDALSQNTDQAPQDIRR